MACFPLSDAPALELSVWWGCGWAVASGLPGLPLSAWNSAAGVRQGNQAPMLSMHHARGGAPIPQVWARQRNEAPAPICMSLQNLALATGSWGRFRNADILPLLGRQPSVQELGEREPCVLDFTILEWSFHHAELEVRSPKSVSLV